MTPAQISKIQIEISNLFSAHAGIAPGRVSTLLPVKGLQGKLYEAHVLATVCENLNIHEGYTIRLQGGPRLILKQKGGPINRTFPYFKVYAKNGRLIGELFTDIYFSTVSHQLRGPGAPPIYGDYHELDIVLLKPGCNGIPNFEQVKIAIECKNTSIKKSIIREMLGFRRELSFLSRTLQPTYFTNWPIDQILADIGLPKSSVHMLYCSDNRVLRYTDNCSRFGILLEHHTII